MGEAKGEEVTSRLADFIARCASESYPEPRTAGHDGIIAQMAPRVAALLRAGAEILDIGCGQGPALEWFKTHGFNALGITVNEMDLNACHAQGFRAVIGDQHDLSRLGTYDCVWARHVLEHSPIPFFTLCEFHRVLKPGGILYAEMPAPDTVCSHESNPNHYSVMGFRMWLQLIRRAGFQFIDVGEMKLASNVGPELYFYFLARKPLDQTT